MPFAKKDAPAESTPAKTAPAAKTTPSPAAKSGPPKVTPATKTSTPATDPKPTKTDGSLDALQREYYTTGIEANRKIIEFCNVRLSHYSSGDGKTHLNVVGSKPVADAKPAAKTSAPAKGEKTAAPTTGAKSAPKPTAAPAPSAAKTPASSPSAGSAGDAGDLAMKTRQQLTEIARSMGMDPTGKKADDLRAMITAKLAEGDAGSEGGESTEGEAASEIEYDELTTQKAEVVMDLLENNPETMEQYIEPNLPEDQRPEGYLGCGGDCMRCPNPDGHADGPTAQVAACYKDIHALLSLEPELPTE